MSEKLSPALASDKETLAPALGGKHVMGQDVDSRALKILFNTYWTSAGWRETPETASEDFAYAIAARTMFPPRSFTQIGRASCRERV